MSDVAESEGSKESRFGDILAVLTNRPSSTIEVEAVLRSRGFQCPDELVRTLAIMRRKGTICGRADESKCGWVWWVNE
jgi:hypothetical protein